MKLKQLVICSLALFATIVAGCTKADWQEPGISVSRQISNETINFTEEGGEIVLTIKSTRPWQIDSIPAWAFVSPASGDASDAPVEITVAVPENPGFDRIKELIFRAGPIKEFITLYQEGPEGPDDGVVDATVTEVIENASTTTCFRLTGTVSGFNSNYCSFDLTDATGKIYVYSVTADTKAEYAGKLENGDQVTIEGYYTFYSAKSQHEIINARITEWISGGGGSGAEAVDATVQQVIDEADKSKCYRLKGTVSGFNATYCSFDLTDETGKIYVYSVTASSKAEYSSKINAGDYVVIEGYYDFYASKSQHEIINAKIVEWKAGGDAVAEVSTVAAVIAEASTSKKYSLTGTVSNFNATYCSFDLTDETGSIYVYSVTAATKTEYASKLKAGDIVTLEGFYQYYAKDSKHEIVNAKITAHNPAMTLPAKDATVATVLSEANISQIYRLTGKVSNFNATYCSFDLTDATGSIYVYSVTPETKEQYAGTIQDGGTVTLEGYYQYYAKESKHEIVNAVITSYTGGEPASGIFTSNVTWTLGNKGTDATVKIDGVEYKAVKLGTSAIKGSFTVKVPEGSTKLSFYAIGWTGIDGKIEIAGAGINETITAKENAGANNSTPFTVSGLKPGNYFTYEFASPLAAETEITFTTATGGLRAIIFGVNAE